MYHASIPKKVIKTIRKVIVIGSSYTSEDGSALIQAIGTGVVHFGSSVSPSGNALSVAFGDTTSQSCPLSGIPGFSKICDLANVPPGFSGHILDFVLFVLYPMALMISMTAVVIGIILFIVGIHRLRHHHGNQNSKQVSYLGTIAYFVAGVILIQYGPVLHMLSSSTFFGMYGGVSTSSPAYMPTMFSYVDCIASQASSAGYNGQTIPGCPTKGADPSTMIQELTFALLLIVGLLSFLRGVFLLVKLGEGGPEGGVLSKAIAHIVAGIIGVNAHAAWALVQDMTSTLGN
jgi:hypothetical protein